MSTKSKWSDNLPEYIIDEIREKTDDLTWRFPDDDYIPEFIAGFRDGYQTGAAEWAGWEAKAKRYEKALKEIIKWELATGAKIKVKHLDILKDIMQTANNAITPKTNANEQA